MIFINLGSGYEHNKQYPGFAGGLLIVESR